MYKSFEFNFTPLYPNKTDAHEIVPLYLDG